MDVSSQLKRWLTGPGADPSVRLRYWTEVEGRSERDPRVRSARKALGRDGWAARMLSTQFPDGHWVTVSSNELYRPKYIATNWVMIVLADLGMTKSDRRIRRLAQLMLDRWSRREGKEGYPLSGFDGETCVTGNAVRSLIRFGYLDHPVVRQSIDWMLRAQKRDGGWHCFPSRTGTLDGWEALAALAEIPAESRSDAVRRSIERGAEFFLEHRLMNEGKVRYSPWFRIHYPNHYYYDVLVGLRMLAGLGYGSDRRMAPALKWLRNKRSEDGTWALDGDHPDFDPALTDYAPYAPVFPFRIEAPGRPSRWATVLALAALARCEAG